MKVAKYTHKTFDGIKIIKGWVLVNNYGEKVFVTINLKSSWITNGSRCKVRQHS